MNARMKCDAKKKTLHTATFIKLFSLYFYVGVRVNSVASAVDQEHHSG